MAQNVVELLQEGCTFTIGDSIEGVLGLISVVNLSADRMCRAHAILGHAEEFPPQESDPARLMVVRKRGSLADGHKRHERGERLVQP